MDGPSLFSGSVRGRRPSGSPPAQRRRGALVFEAFLLLCLLGGAALARRNLRAGRGDRRGAARLGAAISSCKSRCRLLGGHHVATADEGWSSSTAFSNAAGRALVYWILYLALEPFARRRWPRC